ncbi:hypothetical protein C1H46_036107 [Malus baccata]|uniref:Calmodulin-binding domain-containing protein n=1 Tax=Malus baccata TaxID=106549 RepID=A0A540KVV8_MALBA|nr:hypothetical protein C1H46_036107 [Malus baccata]
MEVENIGIPVILQVLDLSGDKGKNNSIPQEPESNGVDVGSNIRTDSIPEIPPEVDLKGGDVRGNSVLGVPQDIEPNGSDSRRSSIPVIPQEMDPKGGDVGVIPLEMEPNGGDVRRNSIRVIRQELEPNGGGIGRNSMPAVPQKMEPNAGDTSRNSVLWIPLEMEPKGGRRIQSRYLRAPTGSCHDYCKYGLRNASEENATAAMLKSATERKQISATNQKPSDSGTKKLDNSAITEKKVLSLRKKEIVSAEKVPSSSKDIDVSMEDSSSLKVQRVQSEPSSLPEQALSLRNSKVISTTGSRSVPHSQTWKLNNSDVMKKKGSSSTKKETASKKGSSPKEIAVCMEELIDSKMKAEQLDQSSFPGSDPSLSNLEDIDVSAEDSTDSKVISTVSPNPSPDSKARKLNHSGVMEKRVLSSKRKENVSSKTVLTPIKEIEVSMEGSIGSKVKREQVESSSCTGQGSSNQGKSGTRKGKEIPEGLSSSVNRKNRSKLPRTPVLVEKKMLEPETVSLTYKHPVKRVCDENAGSFKNLKGLSHMKDQNGPRKVEPEGPCNKDVPEKILYVIESNTENSTVEPTPNGADAPEYLAKTYLK